VTDVGNKASIDIDVVTPTVVIVITHTHTYTMNSVVLGRTVFSVVGPSHTVLRHREALQRQIFSLKMMTLAIAPCLNNSLRGLDGAGFRSIYAAPLATDITLHDVLKAPNR